MQVKKQQLESDMEQWAGPKLGKEYVKAVNCQPAYLIYTQNTSCEMLDWMKHKLESRLQGEISTTSDMQILSLGFPGGSAGKESACSVGDLGLIPGLGRSPGEGKGYPFQYSGWENSMDCIVRGITKSLTQLSDFHFQTIYQFKFFICHF